MYHQNLLIKSLFLTSGREESRVPCQYCGRVDNQPCVSPQAEVCLMCKTKNCSFIYICPLFIEVKDQEKDNSSYKFYHPSLKLSKEGHQAMYGVRNIQITPIVAPSTPVFSQTDHIYDHDVCFDQFQ